MENAADALRMAAGVLIALLLISLVIFVFTRISSLENEKDQQELLQQVSEFNDKFLAFDKTSMYGTDLISVLGLAISNNKIANQVNTANPDGRYDENLANSINIRFTISSNVQKSIITTKYELKDGREEEIDKSEEVEVALAQGTYSLIVPQNDDRSIEIYKTIESIAVEGSKTVEISNRTSNYGRFRTIITEDRSGFSDLKKRIFQCTGIEYDSTGRIKCMIFKEKDDINRNS